jgi:hypothetical protein
MTAWTRPARHGQVPLESLSLGAVLVVLLCYPLLRYRGDDATLGRPLADPYFLTAHREVDGCTAALYRLQEEPGWPSVTDRPRVATRHRLPAHWTVLRLIVESSGLVELPPVSPEVIRVEARRGGAKVRAFPLYRQLQGLPGLRSTEEVPADWHEPLHGPRDEGGWECRQLLLVLQEQVRLAELRAPVLHLSLGLEIPLRPSREP